MLKKFLQPKKVIVLILVSTALLRFYNIWYPSNYVFDEVYHGFTAKEYLAGNKEAWEWWNTPPPGVAFEWTHPPLAKEIMASSMFIFKTTEPWAWRVPGVLFGILGVFMLYKIGSILFKNENSQTEVRSFLANRNEWAGVLAALVFSLDGLNFVQSRIGMNDIYFVTFMLISFYFFLKDRYLFSSIFLGLSLASKWSAIYFLGFILLLLFIQNIKNKPITGFFITIGAILTLTYFLIQPSVNLIESPLLLESTLHLGVILILAFIILLVPKVRKVGVYFLIPPIIYFLSYIPFFLQGHEYKIFTGLQQQMWWYHTGLKATHDYASPWWSWPFNLYPVWYFVDYQADKLANIFASGNPAVFVLGIAALLLTAYEGIRKKSKVLLIIVLGYLFFWLPWALSPRIMFLYHYSPSIPFLSLALGYQLSTLKDKKHDRLFLAGAIVLIILTFLLIYPMLVGIPLPKEMMLLFFETNLTKNPF